MSDSILQRYLLLLAENRQGELSQQDLDELQRQYPYFTQPKVSKLSAGEEGLTDEEIKMLTEELALTANDITALHALMRAAAGDAPFYPPTPNSAKKSTNDTIDTFLQRYGNAAEMDMEVSTIEKLIFNPVAPDYMASLNEAEGEAQVAATQTQEAPQEGSEGVTEAEVEVVEKQPSHQDSLIDAFIALHPDEAGIQTLADIETPYSLTEKEESQSQTAETPRTSAPTQSEAPDRNALLSESLAKVFIRRGKYEKAFEIIHSLSLNYPQKSAYFADQLRFLRKAILINQRRQHLS